MNTTPFILMSKVRARKRFGQHFLHNSSVVARIISCAELVENERVLEVGPGQGVLTQLMLDKKVSLTAVEIDRDLSDLLIKKFPDNPQFELLTMDILKMDWNQELFSQTESWKIITNLPYNISSPFLLKVIRHRQFINKVVILLQKEFAERLAADFGNCSRKIYGSLSVIFALFFDCEVVLDVPSHDFTPPPAVDSQVLRLTPKKDRLDNKHTDAILTFVHEAFRHKRKYFIKFLSHYCDSRGINPAKLNGLETFHHLRADHISPTDYKFIFDHIHEIHD